MDWSMHDWSASSHSCTSQGVLATEIWRRIASSVQAKLLEPKWKRLLILEWRPCIVSCNVNIGNIASATGENHVLQKIEVTKK